MTVLEIYLVKCTNVLWFDLALSERLFPLAP
jgi:hypothetical protein